MQSLLSLGWLKKFDFYSVAVEGTSYLVSGLKVTFVPWSNSTFARTYLNKEKQNILEKVKHTT